MVDYKQLLKKYIEHVALTEGTDFIYGSMGEPFSLEETDVLMTLSQEVEDEYKASIGINK
jgi:hypothetical protein